MSQCKTITIEELKEARDRIPNINQTNGHWRVPIPVKACFVDDGSIPHTSDAPDFWLFNALKIGSSRQWYFDGLVTMPDGDTVDMVKRAEAEWMGKMQAISDHMDGLERTLYGPLR
jgi:hypothetical protein